jgi:uncharacterized protein YjiS (DUF1127 family)
MTTLHHAQAQNSRTIAVFPRILAVIRNRLHQFTAVNELDQLSDRALRDIGVERADIERVARRELARLHAADLITK